MKQMKQVLLLPLILTLPAFAGEPAPAPAPNPCLLKWFAGGSVGYLTNLEEPMYNIHLGATNSCWKFSGWDVSMFGEVGYTSTDESFYDPYRPFSNNFYDIDVDVDIIPVTFNVKLERAISGNLSSYIGAGIGAAYISLDANSQDPFGDDSDSTWVFTGQVFAGLIYKVNPSFEIYGGARWIYFSDPDFSVNYGIDPQNVDSLVENNDCLLEIGLRYNF
jgi:opacity protein-like surface antigen